MRRTRTYGIKIRKDEPFVLDFSNKPEVLFASPAKDKTFKPGEEISVKAVLVDPVLDIMIRRLNDTTRKKKETIKYGDGPRNRLRKARFARSHGHDHRLLRQQSRRGPDALWLRRHLRVLVASTEGPKAGRQDRDIHRNGGL